jgi:hypothetical protein
MVSITLTVSYQPAVILTYEDFPSRLLARKSGSGDVVHRRNALTKSSGRLLATLGQRRGFSTMNHITPFSRF